MHVSKFRSIIVLIQVISVGLTFRGEISWKDLMVQILSKVASKSGKKTSNLHMIVGIVLRGPDFLCTSRHVVLHTYSPEVVFGIDSSSTLGTLSIFRSSHSIPTKLVA